MSQATVGEAGTVPPSVAEPQPYRWRWLALAVILAEEVMDLLDALVTNLAGPAIRADLGGSASLIQWLGAGYTLAMAIGLITGGRLGDLYGRRRMFLVGVAGFTVASALCALSVSPGMLVASRVAQGLFGAVLLPQGLGIIKEVFPPRELAAAFGAFGPVMGISAVGGPILAGWLVDADLWGTGWRAIFLINLPLGLLALLGALRFLPESRPAPASRLDLPGVGLVALGAVLLVYPLVQGREQGWPGWMYGMLVAAVAVFAYFARYEVRRQRAARDPLVVPTLFRRRAFTGGLVAGLAFFTALTGFSLVFSLYLQLGLGYSPLEAGLAGVPQALGMVAAFVIAGAGLARRFGRTLIHTGLVVVLAGVGGMLLTLRLAGPEVTPLAAGTGAARGRIRDGPGDVPVLRHRALRSGAGRDRLGLRHSHRRPATRRRAGGGSARHGLLRPTAGRRRRLRGPGHALGGGGAARGHRRRRVPAAQAGARRGTGTALTNGWGRHRSPHP
ncbi:MFS transporter [Micromonospora avicenniae]|uniref:Drug resistance transporter, EmrB/QacA subfamily n=1 Tax=Micromonospora avicenniae TaxID=1198245 RepID=A0A1N7FIL6_9ACTN|nr:MFS transporter [Micromonospora avicenniae]SIS00163.1 drug resistance transporter, EmrB/QacA subfamily [Micromonospora avicenniae]